MFSTMRGFLNRHRRKFLVTGLAVGGFFVVMRYSQRKIREWREEEVRELLQRSRRNQHFESTERSCNQTIVNVAVCLRKSLTKAADTESVVDRLRNGCDDKISVWNELKALSITRSAVLIYSTTMLVATLRVQLNLMGGRMFKNSQNFNRNGTELDEATQQRYLNLCSYFMDTGVERLTIFVREKVDEITSSISLSNKLTLRDLEQIYWSIMSSLSADATRDPIANMTKYVLPENIEKTEDSVFSRMIDETLDLLESDEVRDLVRSAIRKGFVLLIDHVAEYFIDATNVPNGSKIVDSSLKPEVRGSNGTVDGPTDNLFPNGYPNLNKLTMPMAKIIPIINGQTRDTAKPGDLASDWLQSNIVNEKFKTLGANIYEAFSF